MKSKVRGLEPLQRRFGGKPFFLQRYVASKRLAQEYVKDWKRRDRCFRIVKLARSYAVYRRLK